MSLFAGPSLWDAANRNRVLAVSLFLILAIATADWLTLTYLSLGFLYLFPIMLASAFLHRSGILTLSSFCAGLTERFSALNPEWAKSRMLFTALAFAGCGLFVAELRRNRLLHLQTYGRLQAFVETSPAAIVTIDSGGLIELTNRAAIELMNPLTGRLTGLPIANFLPQLMNVLQLGQGGSAHLDKENPRLRASMLCPARRGDGAGFIAEVWFSTYQERGASKLAAIIADVTADHAIQLPANPTNDPTINSRPALNPRQLEVLRLLFEGLSNREIASRLGLSVSAVQNTLQQLYSKLRAANRSQLVRIALERYRDLL